MGCGSCGTGTKSKPGGCQSNGTCGTSGCNRMSVHDWLVNLPFADPESSCKIIEVSFKQGSRKEFYRNTTLQYFEKGEYITVEGVNGFDVGTVSLTGELVRVQMKKKGVDEFSAEIKKVLRQSTERDIELYNISKDREPSVQARSREMAIQQKLQMKLSEVEIQADGKKATFFYTADDRVDFRELIKVMASEFKVKVEMRQIGIRQEAAKVGGIGSCGRELCCSTWLNDFKSVNTTAARYQNLSINQTKLSGQCGRLKCCLNYELDTYMDALQHFPDNADNIETVKGNAFLIKKDIFKNLMWYMQQGSTKHYPLTIERVKEIKRLNAQGIKPDDLEAVEMVGGKIKEVEPQFVDVVGQINLRSLEKNDRRRRDQQRRGNNVEARNNGGGTNDRKDNNRGQQQQPSGGNKQPQQNKGQQQRPVPQQPREQKSQPPSGQKPPQQQEQKPQQNQQNRGQHRHQQQRNRPPQQRPDNNKPSKPEGEA